MRDAFTCVAEIQYNDMEIETNLQKKGTGFLELAITEPASIAGLTMTWNGEKLLQSFEGISFDMTTSHMPDTALIKAFIDVFAVLSSKQSLEGAEDAGILTLSEMSPSGQFTAEFDKKTGAILTLVVPKASVKATFSQYQILQE